MHLSHITLQHFRNYPQLELRFDESKNINLFVGDNAQGKTNFLEAIAVLALGKSFRTSHHESLIYWEKPFSRIVGEVQRNNNPLTLELFLAQDKNVAEEDAHLIPSKKKNMKKNGVDVPIKDFIGQLTVVLFNPEDLNMLSLSPSIRRKYIDQVLSQVDPLYFDALITYNRTIKQRNKLLALIHEGHGTKNDIEVWDEKLVETGSYILEKRNELIRFYNDKLSQNYSLVVNSEHVVEMKYESSVGNIDTNDIKETFLNALKMAYKNDVKYHQTTKGPHRDDVTFMFDKRDITEAGSRGEMRTLIIALKLAEIKFIEEEIHDKPLLLLDDVFSELDKKRQQFLLETIKPYQSFVTMTHIDFDLGDITTFNVLKGEIV